MPEDLGLRERKKRRTRRMLIVESLRLFGEQGYEPTTLDEMSAAVDISKRTFFSYFASKEDVLFFDSQARLDQVGAALSGRRPGETLSGLLIRVVERALFPEDPRTEFTPELESTRGHLIMSVPALRARARQLCVETQQHVAVALQAAYPDEIDLVEASVVVGTTLGPATIAAMTVLDQGGTGADVWQAIRRAFALTAHGIPNSTGATG